MPRRLPRRSYIAKPSKDSLGFSPAGKTFRPCRRNISPGLSNDLLTSLFSRSVPRSRNRGYDVTRSGGIFSPAGAAATARRAGGRENAARHRDVRTPRQAANVQNTAKAPWPPFSGSAEAENISPLPLPNVPRFLELQPRVLLYYYFVSLSAHFCASKKILSLSSVSSSLCSMSTLPSTSTVSAASACAA